MYEFDRDMNTRFVAGGPLSPGLRYSGVLAMGSYQSSSQMEVQRGRRENKRKGSSPGI